MARIYTITRNADGAALGGFIVDGEDEAFVASRSAAGLTSWSRGRVTIEDHGGTDAEHAAIDASSGVAAIIENWRARAVALAAAYVGAEDKDEARAYAEGFAVGAHRRVGVMRAEAENRLGLHDELGWAVEDVLPVDSWSKGARFYARQRIADAAWRAFGDEVDRLLISAEAT